MRVSLINLNLVAKDAIGHCIIEQARFFRDRGDIVHIFVEHPPEGVPEDVAPYCHTVTLADLQHDAQGIFAASDLYIFHYPSRYSLLEKITSIDGGLVIFYYHNVTPPELWNWEPDKPILEQGRKGVWLANYADLVISPSTYNLADLAPEVQLDPARLLAIPIPVDVNLFSPGPPPQDLIRKYRLADSPVLLYVGRMASNKRIDKLVEVLAAVRRHPQYPQPRAKLLLVGDHDSAPAYRLEAKRAREIARNLGVSNGVIFTGRVDRLPDYYRLASVFVTASQHEGFCVPLIEAMASGIPIVAANSTAIPETLDDAGLLVDLVEDGGVDVAKMSDLVATVLVDQDLRRDLVERGLRRAAEFSVERYREKLAHVLDTHCKNLPLRVQPSPHIGMAEAAQVPIQETGQDAHGAYWPELETEARVGMPDYVVRSKVPVLGGLIVWVRRNLTSHLKEPYVDPIIQRQEKFNLRSAWIINELTRRISALKQQNDELATKLSALSIQLQKIQADTITARIAALESEMQKVQAAAPAVRIHALEEELRRVKVTQRQVRAAQARLEAQLAELENAVLRQVASGGPEEIRAPDLGSEDLEAVPQRCYGINYRDLNEAIGGDLEITISLYEPFVPYFQGRSGFVLDLGCGRGAFLELMRRYGIAAKGVEIDPDMVEACRRQGFDVVQSDIFAFLQQQQDSSLGGIFCAHVVEHLPRSRLVELANLCWLKLQPGSALVWVTPHGGSLAPLHATFYKDLTHTRPLHPELIAFLFESNGFHHVEVQTLSDIPKEMKLQLLPEDEQEETIRVLNRNFQRLNDLIFGHVDCAVIGIR